MAWISKLPDDGIELSNDLISVLIYPKFGGKIASLKSRGKEWLWQNPHLGTIPDVYLGASYDDHFYGGMDELFPNDFPTTVNGIELPDHGELWSRSWDYEILTVNDNPIVCMSVVLESIPVKAERKILMDEGKLVIEIKLTNLSGDSIPYLWVLHPAFRIGPQIRFHIPDGEVIVADEINGRIAKGTARFRWPGTEIGIDLSTVPERGKALESYYIVNISKGQFFVEDISCGEALSVQFPLQHFPHLWLFMPLGGWWDHYLAVIEPASGYPTDLKVAMEEGTHSLLEGRSSVTSCIYFSIVHSEEIDF